MGFTIAASPISRPASSQRAGCGRRHAQTMPTSIAVTLKANSASVNR